MSVLKSILLLSIACLCMCPNVSADEELRSIRFSIVGLGKTLPSDCYFAPKEGAFEKVGGIASNYRTSVFEYVGPAQFQLFRMGENGEPYVYAEVELPVGSSDLMFVLLPSRDSNPSRARLLVYDDSLDGFPSGSYRFVNTTPHRIAGLVGQDKLLLESGKASVVQIDLAQNEYFSVDLRSEQNDVWNPGFSSRWRHRQSTRIIMFLYTDPVRPTSILAQTIPQHFRQ